MREWPGEVGRDCNCISLPYYKNILLAKNLCESAKSAKNWTLCDLTIAFWQGSCIFTRFCDFIGSTLAKFNIIMHSSNTVPHLGYQVKHILCHYSTIFFGSHHQNLSACKGGAVGVAKIACRAGAYFSCNSGDRLKLSNDWNCGRSLRSSGHSAGSYLNREGFTV